MNTNTSVEKGQIKKWGYSGAERGACIRRTGSNQTSTSFLRKSFIN